MPKWTQEQQSAIESRGENLLLSAAAGSGKTAVLVERILRMILNDHVDIDRLLIVTFTKAAAGEMRERIGRAIVKAINDNEGDTVHLRRQLTLLNKGKITTIHSFCMDVIRQNFHLLDMDPGFRVGEMTEVEGLRREAIDEVFEEFYKKGSEEFFLLVESFGNNKDDAPLKDLVIDSHTFIQSQPDPFKWLDEKGKLFDLSGNQQLDEHPWTGVLKNGISNNLEGAEDYFVEAIKVTELTGGPYPYRETLREDLDNIKQLRNTMRNDFVNFYESLAAYHHPKLKPIRKNNGDVDQDLKEMGKRLRDQGKKAIDDLRKKKLPTHPEGMKRDLENIKPLMETYNLLIMEYHHCYREKKLERGLLDFNDLEHYALDILGNTDVQNAMKEQFLWIFIDEYQDSNLLQEALMSKVKREDNLFMVGDVKQSIYRFRLGDPSLFLEKYDNYNRSGEDSEEVNRRIDLSKNFRSRGAVITAVNDLFQSLMNKELGEVDYSDGAALIQGRDEERIPDDLPELHLVETEGRGEEELDEQIEEMENQELEARIMAKRIKEMVAEFELYDDELKQLRRATYRDMVILLRSSKSAVPIYTEAFKEEGIPLYSDAEGGYFETMEIQMFIDLLRVIDNKMQDVPLLGALRSPIGGFSTEELAEIRIGYRKGHFYHALIEASRLDTPLGGKCRSFLEKVQNWKEEERILPLDDLLWKIMRDTGYYYFVGAMPQGKLRQGNLRILLERTVEFQKNGVQSLFHLLRMIEKIKTGGEDFGMAKIVGEKEDVVRIISIHKSKGLEFPIVFLGGMGKQFNKMDTAGKLLKHKDLGFGPRYVDLRQRTYRDTLGKLAMKEVIERENLSEEMRILYVALTRAEDKLILMGSIKDLSKRVQKWSEPMNLQQRISAKTPLDWVGPLLLRHRDGKLLRDLIEGIEPTLIEGKNSRWKIHIHTPTSYMNGLEQEEQKGKVTRRRLLDAFDPVEISRREKEEIYARLSWTYHEQEATKIPSKMTVTEVKNLGMKDLNQIQYKAPMLKKKPGFMVETGLSPMEKGTLLHFFLQHLNFHQSHSLTSLEGELESLVKKELIRSEDGKAIDLKKILAFLDSQLGKRMKDSHEIYQEKPFNLLKKAKDLIQLRGDTEEEVLIQGVIDCFFKEKDQWILVDYKSDAIWEGNRKALIETYRSQIHLYKEALETLTGIKVKESYIYFFHIGEAVEV